MYLNHFGLSRQPFNLASDPAFLWTGEKQREALELLKSGILLNRGFIVLTGEVGTGKTTLTNAFSGLNEIATITVTVPDPDMEPLDFLNFVAREFDMGEEFTAKDEFTRRFKSFLLSSYAAYKKVLIVIDEAQRLNHALLAVIAELAAIELAGRRMLKIFFVGQVEFNDMLMEQKNAAVRSEVVAAYNLEPLAAGETFQYIGRRLEVAGARKKLFTPQAMMLVHRLSGGYPRTINVLCDQALLQGFGAGVEVVDVDIVAGCARALDLRPVPKRSAPAPVYPFPQRPPEDPSPTFAVAGRRHARHGWALAAVGVFAAAAGVYVAARFGLLEGVARMFERMLAFIPWR